MDEMKMRLTALEVDGTKRLLALESRVATVEKKLETTTKNLKTTTKDVKMTRKELRKARKVLLSGESSPSIALHPAEHC